MKVSCATFLVLSFLLSSSFLEITAAYQTPTPCPAPSPSNLEAVCGFKCEYRCSKAGEHKRCMQYCKMCCKDCADGCVPDGPYADKSECPCYAHKKNSKGGPKCP